MMLRAEAVERQRGRSANLFSEIESVCGGVDQAWDFYSSFLRLTLHVTPYLLRALGGCLKSGVLFVLPCPVIQLAEGVRGQGEWTVPGECIEHRNPETLLQHRQAPVGSLE